MFIILFMFEERYLHATTIICVRKKDKKQTNAGEVTIGADGQISHGSTIVKNNVNKIRTIHTTQNKKVVVGFAGVTNEAVLLLNNLEHNLYHYPDLERACIEVTKQWRSTVSGKSDVLFLISNGLEIILLSGNGDIFKIEEDVIGIGSGGLYASCAAKGMLKHSKLSSEEIAKESLLIASETCVFTNDVLNLSTIKY